MLDTVVICGEDIYCSVVFGIPVGVLVFSVCCPLWSSVYECHKVECEFTSPLRTECGMFVMRRMQC